MALHCVAGTILTGGSIFKALKQKCLGAFLCLHTSSADYCLNHLFGWCKACLFESPKSKKGAKGEAIVAFALSNSLEPEVYKQINDIIIPRNNYHNQASRTDSAQIDHIVLSEYGIFL